MDLIEVLAGDNYFRRAAPHERKKGILERDDWIGLK